MKRPLIGSGKYSPNSDLRGCSLKYANERRRHRRIPLNFRLGHGVTEITEVESRLLSAARPWPFFCHLLDLISFE